ncbi:DNA gyrase inhibitor YacG [Planctomicrobium sp. SH527]|uniref:DNA gyrase inhibitor YacG n=1 Tax=Planctomicrobium sp. SH527 TaxID=3448123 RepID=UPI003F5BDF86
MTQQTTCPVCKKVLPPEIDGNSYLFPFCCTRCKQVDLYKWLSGDYAVIEKLTPDRLEGTQPEDVSPESDR